MKKKHFLMAALLYLSCTAAVLTACGGDDNDNPATIRFINSTTAIVHDSFVDEGLQEESYVTLVTDEVAAGGDDDEPQ